MAESNDVETEDFCYICFEGATRGPSGELEPLVQVCRCPTRVHRRCVARWQLYSAGKREEKSCRFCQGTLPDWKEVLTPRALPPAVPILSIYYNNTCCRMKVRPGPDGLRAFLRQLEVIVGRDVANVNFVFRCRCPDTGAEIFLQGLQAFEAAMHCACVRAAQRSLQQHQQQQHLLLQQQQQQQQQHRQLLELSSLHQQQQQREVYEHQQQQQQEQLLPLHERRRQQQLLLLQHCEVLQRQRERNQLRLPRQLVLDTGEQQTISYGTAMVDETARIGDSQVMRASASAARMYGGATATAAVAATAITTRPTTTAVAAAYVPSAVHNTTGLHSSALALFPFPCEPHQQLRGATAALGPGAGIELASGPPGPEVSSTAIASIEGGSFPRSSDTASTLVDGASRRDCRSCWGTDISVAANCAACVEAARPTSAATERTSLQQPPASIPPVSPSSPPSATVRQEQQSPALMPLLQPPQSPPSMLYMHCRESRPAVESAGGLDNGVFVRPIASVSGALHISSAATTAPALSQCRDDKAPNGGQPRTIPASGGMRASTPPPLEQAAFMITPVTACDAAPTPASPLSLTPPLSLLSSRPPAAASYTADSNTGVASAAGTAIRGLARWGYGPIKIANGEQEEATSQVYAPLGAANLMPPAGDNGSRSVFGGSSRLAPSPAQPTRPPPVQVEAGVAGGAESPTSGRGGRLMCSVGISKGNIGGVGRVGSGKLSAALLKLKALKIALLRRFVRKAASAAAAFA
ncbi:hypothetical protein Vafri_16743 [Volvox africanus]|uniref:RING-CH-type domain-containing protein n=1 Tax=Volvox africanus TaxID=51714 RepID=A0A8J4BJN8_9CHLO|nr:hypothetical protein Vafri_16743 [Volvox africanus]